MNYFITETRNEVFQCSSANPTKWLNALKQCEIRQRENDIAHFKLLVFGSFVKRYQVQEQKKSSICFLQINAVTQQ